MQNQAVNGESLELFPARSQFLWIASTGQNRFRKERQNFRCFSWKNNQ
jgi:hypothetical protein